jgi:hypothetical protein
MQGYLSSHGRVSEILVWFVYPSLRCFAGQWWMINAATTWDGFIFTWFIRLINGCMLSFWQPCMRREQMDPYLPRVKLYTHTR